MKIPLEVVFSPVKGGMFVADRKSGEWWKAGKLIADWRISRSGDVSITWHDDRAIPHDAEAGE